MVKKIYLLKYKNNFTLEISIDGHRNGPSKLGTVTGQARVAGCWASKTARYASRAVPMCASCLTFGPIMSCWSIENDQNYRSCQRTA